MIYEGLIEFFDYIWYMVFSFGGRLDDTIFVLLGNGIINMLEYFEDVLNIVAPILRNVFFFFPTLYLVPLFAFLFLIVFVRIFIAIVRVVMDFIGNIPFL